MTLAAEDDADILVLPARPLVKAVTHIRSTLIMSSQTTLRAEGLFPRYQALLADDLREELVQLGAPSWLSLPMGLAHYAACDALGLSEDAVVTMAQRVAAHREGTFLGVALNLARGSGVTPWHVVGQLPRLWSRAFMGGAVGAKKLGPKELRITYAGWSCAGIPYCRYAIRGLTLGVVKLLSVKPTCASCLQARMRTASPFKSPGCRERNPSPCGT